MKPISLTGFMGCGKSSTGRELARILGADFVDLDDLVVSREGRSIPEIFAGGEAVFRRAEAAALTSLLESHGPSPLVIALGGGTLTSPQLRDMVLERTACVWLRARLDTIRDRLGFYDSSRPLFKDADRLFAERESIYSSAGFVVDTDGLTPREAALRIAGLVEECGSTALF